MNNSNPDSADQVAMQLKKNVESIRRRIEVAAQKSGRSADQITLIGVTKYVDAAMTRAVFEAGCLDLGENRPQVLWDKAQETIDLSINWHMIGHLQRNKVKRTVACSTLIHSVDSLRLLTAINDAGANENKVVDVLIEVNVSGEEAKHGFKPDELSSVISDAGQLKNVSILGLMCMAGLNGDKDSARNEFASLRKLRDENQNPSSLNVQLKELSMGMSGDFEVAIEEGATMVRVGSLLFHGI
jgi:pyridoxal phosphate enzyme (YggS family)